MEMKWYIAYTKPDYEKKVSRILTQKNIINFCPSSKVSTRNGPGFYKQMMFKNRVFIRTFESQLFKLKKIKE